MTAGMPSTLTACDLLSQAPPTPGVTLPPFVSSLTFVQRPPIDRKDRVRRLPVQPARSAADQLSPLYPLCPAQPNHETTDEPTSAGRRPTLSLIARGAIPDRSPTAGADPSAAPSESSRRIFSEHGFDGQVDAGEALGAPVAGPCEIASAARWATQMRRCREPGPSQYIPNAPYLPVARRFGV